MSENNSEPNKPTHQESNDERSTVGGSPKRRFERRPNFDMQASLSRDGKYWIIKKLETWILPRRYLEVISESFKPQIGSTETEKQSSLVLAANTKRSPRKWKRNVDGNG